MTQKCEGSGCSSSDENSYDIMPKVCCNKPKGANIYQQISASCSGAVITSMLMTPLDVVKIRLQQQTRPFPKGECFYYHNGLMEHACTACEVRKPCEWYQRPGNFKGTTDGLIKIAKHEGIRSLWSGLSPTLIMALPATVFYYTVFDNLSDHLKKRFCCRRTLTPQKWTPPDWVAAAIAGKIARGIAVTVVNPVEMIRTKMQSEKLTYAEVGTMIKTSFATKGISSFYLGWTPSLLRDIPFSGIYWAGYDFMKTSLMKKQGSSSEAAPFMISFACGATAGCVATFFTHPFDVIKTRIQVRMGGSIEEMNQSVLTVAREMYQTRGLSAFGAGLVPRMAKVSPSCAIMISFYEYFKHLFQKS